MLQQPLDDLLEGLTALHPGERHRETQALADDVGGGVGVEGAGAAFSLAAIDFGFVVQGLAVVGNQVKVDGYRLATPLQRLGQIALECAVDASLEFVRFGEGGEQGVVDGAVGRGIAESGAGGGEGGDAAGGVEEDRPEYTGGAFGAVVGQTQVLLAEQACVRTGGGERIMGVRMVSLPG